MLRFWFAALELSALLQSQ